MKTHRISWYGNWDADAAVAVGFPPYIYKILTGLDTYYRLLQAIIMW